MKLDKLWIKDFKNLKDVEVDFDEEQLVTVVIGWNGAGKSNLIEALVIIFRDLDLGNSPKFAYRLEYICRGNRIVVNAAPDKPKKDQYEINCSPVSASGDLLREVEWTEISFNQFHKDENRSYLPANVFGYYSGPSDRLAVHFYDHQRKFRDQLLYPHKYGLDEATLPLRPLFYAQKVHSNFVLLAFFLGSDKKVKKFLKEKLFIHDLESVLFVLNKPDWGPDKVNGDERVWGASGAVKPFLDRLYSSSLAPMKRKIKVPHPMKRNADNVEALFLFLKDIEALREVGENLEAKDFFKLLESIHFSNLIHEVRIRVKVEKSDGTLTFRELSEGEQQLLMVLGLLRFTREDESLFLLDEPDTHLNPAWSMEYIKYLQDVAGLDPYLNQHENSHIVLATHDPLVMAGLKKDQIQIMKRNELDMKVSAELPLYDPKGLGYSGILTSDMFGLRSDLDQETLEYLDEHAQLLSLDQMSTAQEKRYKDLTEKLRDSGFLQSYSDPYFAAFVKGWAKRNKINQFKKPFLSDRDRKALDDLTDEIFEEIESEEGNK
ncbi:MAG: AAA family ATPase [Candidatus Thiodiazotropha sp. (ex Ctena orbiculata)]|nr:AAA family ATPase [Candidatus Thiodiazotropha sp. (ex Codakia orbicularis)]MBV2127217.1 AAA family ATPase [Candidatus Thiodiazotropha taylori]